MTDEEYIRAMKKKGFPASCKELQSHNDRLDKIAARLEENKELKLMVNKLCDISKRSSEIVLHRMDYYIRDLEKSLLYSPAKNETLLTEIREKIKQIKFNYEEELNEVKNDR